MRRMLQISWTNNLLIISRCHSEEEREFYLLKSIDEHYSKREGDLPYGL